MSSALTQQFSQLRLFAEEQVKSDNPDGIADGLDKEFEQIIALKEGTPSADNVRKEVYWVLEKQFQNMPRIPLERDGRRTIDVFSLGQISKGGGDMFSITCERSQRMMYLNVRINKPPSIGELITLDGSSGPSEEDAPFLLNLMSGANPQYGIQRKRKDRSGRTVFQFPFSVDRNTADRILDVIHELVCCFEI